MDKVEYFENDTFKFGEDCQLNACVGNNGYVDMYRYQNGYIQATKLMLQSINDYSFDTDSMVYPVIYSARHSLELFLKNQIQQLYEIETQVTGNESVRISTNTHSLDILFKEFDRLTKFDDRYTENVKNLYEYFKDYAQVDDTGETFRYPEDHEGVKHLVELWCVNLGIFSDRYLQMCEVFVTFDHLTEFLYLEYFTGSVIRGVSRTCIEAISKQLPPRNQWGFKIFDKIKAKILEENDISNNTFKLILDFIQKHFEFASNIGIEIPLETLTPEELGEFLKLYEGFEAVKESSFMKHKHEYTELIKNNLSKEAIASIAALRALAHQYEYSETYEQLYAYFDSLESWDIVFNNLIGFGPVHLRLKNSLQLLGQKSLLERLQNDNN